jgi:hypothetical protein
MKLIRNYNYDPHRAGRRKLAIEAFDDNCIIFSTTTKKFYTPVDFVESNEQVIYVTIGAEEHCNCKLHSVEFTAECKLSEFQEALNEYQTFMHKLTTAFSSHPSNG